MNKPQYNIPLHFETLFKIFSNEKFLNKEGLGGELAFFIHSFPARLQTEVDLNISSLIKRLQTNGIEILEVNLYLLCIDIIKQNDLFEKIKDQEKVIPKRRLLKILNGPLNIETALMPEIVKRVNEAIPKIIFLTGIGAAFPIIRSHTILNNLPSLVGEMPLVLFFPGTYNNQSLILFDRLKDDNYYRAHNLNDYKI